MEDLTQEKQDNTEKEALDLLVRIEGMVKDIVAMQERSAKAHEQMASSFADIATAMTNMSIRAMEYIEKKFHSVP